MEIVSEKLLDRFRGHGQCSWCRNVVSRLEPDHIFTRGSGRLDISCNIVALCGTFTGGQNCHHQRHQGHITPADLLLVAAAREGCLQNDIEELVYRLRRLDKRSSPADVADAVEGLSVGARKLGRRVLSEAGIMEAA